MQFFETTKNHESDSLNILFDQGINSVLQIRVEVSLAVLHYDTEMIVLDLIVKYTDNLRCQNRLRFRGESAPGSRSL